MGNLAHRWVTCEVCSSVVLVTSGAVTVIPTVPGAVLLKQCPCSLIVLVFSGVVTVVPAVPGAVPLEISPLCGTFVVTRVAYHKAQTGEYHPIKIYPPKLPL